METAEECQVKDFGKNYQLKKITSQKKKKKKWGLISCSNLPVGGPVHMNQHLMANAQRKILKKN